MAATKTPRDQRKVPLCGAKKRNGKTCRAFAGQGTSHKGVGRCKNHGGSTPNHIASAAVAMARNRMVELGRPMSVSPGQLMAGVINLQAGDLFALTTAIQELEDDTTPEGQALVRLYNAEKERSARITKLAADMGVDERLLALAESQTDLMAQVIERIADDIQLTAKQKRALGPAVRRQLALTQQAESEVVEGTAA
jgi:hypothetical protein